jgi:hypothetical protein
MYIYRVHLQFIRSHGQGQPTPVEFLGSITLRFHVDDWISKGDV